MMSALVRLRALRAGRLDQMAEPSASQSEAERPEWDDSATLISASGQLLVINRPDDLPPEWAVDWLERAAIREFDGGQSREHAEAEALQEIVAQMRRAGFAVKKTRDLSLP